MKEAQRYEQLAEKNEKAANQAIYGSPGFHQLMKRIHCGEPSIILSLAMAGRGRVWSGGQVRWKTAAAISNLPRPGRPTVPTSA